MSDTPIPDGQTDPHRETHEETNILVVSPYWYWRDNTGASQRVGLIVRALRPLGKVAFLALAGSSDPWIRRPDSREIAKLWVARYPGRRKFFRRLYSFLLGPELGKEVAARREFSRVGKLVASERFDLVVFVRETSWLQFHRKFSAPCIVDVDDFPEVALRRWLSIGKNDDGGAITRRQRARINLRIFWHSYLHKQVAASGSVRLVVSEIDANRYPGSGRVIVPNVPPDGTRPGLVPLGARGNILTFVGLQIYGPNIDAAEWFATQILPIVRQSVPDVQFWIIGQNDERVAGLAKLKNVRLCGSVPDVREYLDETRVVVVPLRVGAGSRIKILEAMASEVPVVTTSVGAEGIDAKSGVHLSVANDAESFAAACVTALQADDRIFGMVAKGRQLVESRYSSRCVAELIRDIALRVVAGNQTE